MKTDSQFTALFGDAPQNQVLSFLFAHPDSDYSKTELASLTRLSRPTIYQALEPLLRFDLVIVSRKIANTTLYRLNVDSVFVKTLLTLNEDITADKHRFEYDRKKIRRNLEHDKNILIALS